MLKNKTKSKKLQAAWQTFLEINSASFKYYLAVCLLLVLLEIFWPGGFVFRYLRFPLSWFVGFVSVSGLAKLFFDLDKIITWLRALANQRQGLGRLLWFFLILQKFSKKPDAKKFGKYGLLFFMGLSALAILVSLIVGPLVGFRIVFGSCFVLFLPGLALTFAFLKEIDLVERITLSFVLSISALPLLVFYLNLAGVKITAYSVAWENIFLIILGLGIAFWQRRTQFFD